LGDWPAVVSQDWRPATDDDPHIGVDLMYRRATTPTRGSRFVVPEAVPVLAAGAGVVRFAADTRRGYAVIIAHARGSTYYVHLASLLVARGEVVTAGQPLGLVGFDPTDAARVRHLHFEIWPHGTRSSAVNPSPRLATWGRVEYTRATDGARNASWWAVKTPGVIGDEIKITQEDVSALGRDIYATFRRPWVEQFDKARARFKTERGRDPGVGKDSDPVAEWATVYSWMAPPPSATDRQWKTYQGAFVHSWGEFERSWQTFYAEHADWSDRMWRGTYDQALDFRSKTKAWRTQFESLGGTPSSPEPEIPREGGPFGDIPWKRVLLVAGGIAAAVVVVPPLITAARKGA